MFATKRLRAMLALEWEEVDEKTCRRRALLSDLEEVGVAFDGGGRAGHGEVRISRSKSREVVDSSEMCEQSVVVCGMNIEAKQGLYRKNERGRASTVRDEDDAQAGVSGQDPLEAER